MSHLLLGPIVGHTTDQSTIIWIRVGDDPANYTLRIRGAGVFPFGSTEDPPGPIEFGTAVAVASGLRSDWEYRYQILRRTRVVGEGGTFRTMPPPQSMADVLFVSISCSHATDPGAWPLLDRYVKSAKPRFIVMMGDQVYLDDGDETAAAVWPNHFDSKPAPRRQAIADKYQEHWSREPVRSIMANTPCYMMWDDHDIRNGWGSFATDSPALAAQYPRGAKIAAEFNAYFEDCRAAYWHFQGCRNPPAPASLGLPPPGKRVGMPFYMRCGRLLVLVLDDRGARDLWRPSHPVLGEEQWTFLTKALGSLTSDIDALALVVPLPLTSMAPDGATQRIYGDRTDDVDLFKDGNRAGLLELFGHAGKGALDATVTITFGILGAHFGGFRLDELTDVRDNWANHFCQAEQAALIRAAGQARMTNRLASQPRGLVLIGGDLHAGGMFDLTVSDPDFSAPSLVTSGISKQTGKGSGIVGFIMDEDFDVADGIHARLQKFTNVYNFGVTQVLFGGQSAVITNAVAHEGESDYWSLRLPFGQK